MAKRESEEKKEKKVTIDDLLVQSDVNSIIEELVKEKSIISGLFVLNVERVDDNTDRYIWRTSGMTAQELVYQLEKAKLQILQDEDELDRDEFDK